MDRKNFLKTLAIIPFAGYTMKLSQFETITNSLNSTETMPLLFAGHGSPMNAIEQNEFTEKWSELGKTLPLPKAIICISAHWETKGTFLTAMEKPRTIHDFGGFPKELYSVEYPAPGDPRLASEASSLLADHEAGLDLKWGLDHGTWSVVRNIYPEADIPVIQMSLDYTKSAAEHYQLARHLAVLRKKGILIMGSGNMVHNLGMLNWQNPDSGSDWALEANDLFKKLIMENGDKKLIDYQSLGKAVQLAVPTPEHYLPLLYILGLKESNDRISFFNDKAVMGSLTMTSVLIGN
jgi:4,5-DOPA dioxygenase extradiol